MHTSSNRVIGTTELFYSAQGVSLCLVPNRRHRSMRVIDFRSGANPAKSTIVARLARQEDVERVFTLVERDEITTWTRLGFQREGTIPGYYKRSDAWVLGTTVDRLMAAHTDESGMRRALVETDSAIAERTYQLARRDPRVQTPPTNSSARLQPARDADVRRAIAAAGRARRALTGFEPFGRDVAREQYVCTARGGFSLVLGAERQLCFDNAFLELLLAPRTDKETASTCAAVGLVCDELFEQDVASCFAFSPADEAELAVVFLANGFRKTGVLRAHLTRRDERVDAFLWTRKLAVPTDP
ncbi:MAG: hypothetical protein JW751_14830 [Polyangiaceae bacterium]|nr:hypothetical protein [Polyangiaceae bacterium]